MIVEIWHPGTPSTPGIPPRYVETSGPGWASGAVSIPVTSGDGGYKWSIPASVVGVFVGLSSNYPGAGYFGIEHALLFSRGVVDIYERGQKLGTLGSYVSGDEWTMFRQAGRVWFLKNGVKEYDRPSLLTGSFRLAATQYLTGDTVVDADTAAVGAVPTSGDGFALVRPLISLGFEVAPDNYGVAELSPLTSGGREDGHAWGTSSFGRLLALGGDRPYGIGYGELLPLYSYGESGLITPDYGTGIATISQAFIGGRMIPGGVGVGVMATRLLALGSDRPIAQGVAELNPVFAWGAEAIELRGSVMKTSGRYQIVASVRESDINAAQIVGPALVMSAYTGPQARLKGPKLNLAASGTVPAMARVSRNLPSLRLVASGTVTEVAGAAISLQGSFSVKSWTGLRAVLVGPGGFETAGIATTTERAESRISAPSHYAIRAEASSVSTAKAVLIGPALTPAPSGKAWLVAPSLVIRAEAGEVVSVTYESYAINLSNGAVSRYVDFPFDQVLRFGNRHFGVRADGVYELKGDSDNGANIVSEVKTFQTDFSATNMKRVPYVYVVGQAQGEIEVGVQADNGTEYQYPTDPSPVAGTQAARATVGKGVRGNFYSFSFSNPGGESFEIDRIETIVEVTTRTH